MSDHGAFTRPSPFLSNRCASEAGSAYGATFPDFPGCFAAADEIQDLPKAAQEAAEAHFCADSDPIPAPTESSVWANDEAYTGGFWMMVDIARNS